MAYNLFADRLLQLEAVPQSVYDTGAAFYSTKSNEQYGIPVISDYPETTLGMVELVYVYVSFTHIFDLPVAMMFAAASMASTSASVQNSLVAQVYNYASQTQNNSILPLIYDPSIGHPTTFSAGSGSPAIGSVFSILALKYVYFSICSMFLLSMPQYQYQRCRYSVSRKHCTRILKERKLGLQK